jgi:hypothetical protein
MLIKSYSLHLLNSTGFFFFFKFSNEKQNEYNSEACRTAIMVARGKYNGGARKNGNYGS